MCVIAAGNDRRCSASEEHSFDISTSAKLKSKKRDIKMQWKYVVLQYLVLGPGLEPQVLVNITAKYKMSCEWCA